jgi:hypothetical protein
MTRRLSVLAALVLSALSVASGGARVAPRVAAKSSPARESAEGPFVFAYFVRNGEDGLHLAYSEDGLVWEPLAGGRSLLKPTIGRDRLMRDPHVTRGPDGLYRMVWTSSWTEPVVGYAESKDLINWSEQRSIRPVEHEPMARNVWAPETFYDAGKKQYLLFWSTTIPGRFPETDNAGDKGYNHRIYFTTTKDFRSFAPTRLFYEPGFNVIDATVVRDGRRYVMFLKDETRGPVAQKNLRWAESARAEGPYGPASAPITGKYWAEGPTALRVGGRWIVYFDKYTEHRYGAVASEDLLRWEDISERVKFPEGTRHGTALRVPRAVLGKLLALK